MSARRRAARLRRAEGFTLIEVAIGLTLMAVAFIAAGGLITTLASSEANSRTRTMATFHLQRQVERLHELPYPALADGQADTVLANGATLRATWDVTPVVPGVLSQVDVTVRQIPAGPGGREVAATIFIADPCGNGTPPC